MVLREASEVFAMLAEMIEASTKKVKVCVPDSSFYASDSTWSKEEIEVIDADTLVELLRAAVAGVLNHQENKTS